MGTWVYVGASAGSRIALRAPASYILDLRRLHTDRMQTATLSDRCNQEVWAEEVDHSIRTSRSAVAMVISARCAVSI